MKPSPGPWKCSAAGLISGPTGRIALMCEVGEQAEADARLLATAPDLAFALELEMQRSMQLMSSLGFSDASIIESTADGRRLLERLGIEPVSRLLIEIGRLARDTS